MKGITLFITENNTMKRLILPLLGLLTTVNLSAQSLEELMNAAMKEAGTGSGSEISITENTDPFVPLKFTGTFRMEMHSYKNGTEEKESPANIKMAMTPERMAMLPLTKGGKEEVRMVFDLKEKRTYTLMTDEKGERNGIVMKMMKVNVKGGETTEEDADVKFERTNDTKVIEGQTCRRFTYSSTDGNGEAWIAEDIKFDIMSAFASMAGSMPNKHVKNMGFDGLMMENTWNSADGKERMVMYTRDLQVGKVDETLFSTAGYTLQDMTALPTMGR
jgi:hypothetical protein